MAPFWRRSSGPSPAPVFRPQPAGWRDLCARCGSDRLDVHSDGDVICMACREFITPTEVVTWKRAQALLLTIDAVRKALADDAGPSDETGLAVRE